MVTNRKIEEFLLRGEIAIDALWGLSMYEKYLEQGANLEKGLITLADIKGVNFHATSFQMDSPGMPQGKTAEIVMTGVMQLEDSLSTPGAKSIAAQFEAAYADPEVTAIKFKVNSGGGELLAGQEINRVISARNKPVHTVFDMLGSAAYLATMNSDKIWAAGPFSQVGSIGTMVTINEEKIREYAATFTSHYATQSTEKNKAFEDLTKGDPKQLIKELTTAASIFINEVNAARKGVDDSVFKGGIFNAQLGKDLGLIDGILPSKPSTNNNKTVSTMNFKAIATQLARIFNWNLEGKSETEVEAMLTEHGTLAELRLEWQGDVQKQFTEMQGSFKTLNETLQGQVEELKNLTAKVETQAGDLKGQNDKIEILTKEADTLKGEKLELEKQVASLKANGGNKEGDELPEGQQFLATLEKAGVEGDSKY